MAILEIGTPYCHHSGRLLILPFYADEPDDHSVPDERIGFAAGIKLSLNGVELVEPARSVESVDYTVWPLVAKAAATGGSISATNVFFRFVHRNTTTGEIVNVSGLGGKWGSDDYPLGIASGTTNVLNFRPMIPTPSGCALDIYISTLNDLTDIPAMAASLRLLKSNATLTSGVYTATSLTPENASQECPRKIQWRVKYLLPENLRIAFGTSNTVSCDAGLIFDKHGNETEAFDTALTNYSRLNADGELAEELLEHWPGRLIRYVAGSHGSDSNDGAFATPFANLQAAMESVPQFSDSLIYVLEDEELTLQTQQLFKSPFKPRSGVVGDLDHPLVITTYWNDAYGARPNKRPRLPYRDTEIMNIVATGGNGLGTWGNVIWHGMHWQFLPSVSGNYPNQGHIQWSGSASDVMFLDCNGENVYFAPGGDDDRYSERISILNCTSGDQIVTGTAHRQAISAGRTHDFEIGRSNFYRNSFHYVGLSLERDNQNHCIYLQNGSESATMWGLIAWIVSSDAFKARAAMSVFDCLGGRFGVLCNNGKGPSNYNRVVGLYAEAQGLGLIWTDNSTSIPHRSFNVIQNCLVAHSTVSTAAARSIDPFMWNGTSPNIRRDDGIVRNNTVVGATHALRTVTGPPRSGATIEIYQNILGGDLGYRGYYWKLSSGSSFAQWDQRLNIVGSLDSTMLELWIGGAQAANSPAGAQSFGFDDETTYYQASEVGYRDSTYGIAEWSEELGGPDNEEDWLASLIAKELGEDQPWLNGENAYPYFANAYQPVLPAIDATAPWAYYGFADNRPVEGANTWQMIGASSGSLGVAIPITFQPSTISSDRLNLGTDQPGAWSPDHLIWSNSSLPKIASYTGAAVGTHNTNADRVIGSPTGIVATKAITFPGSGPGKRARDFQTFLRRA